MHGGDSFKPLFALQDDNFPVWKSSIKSYLSMNDLLSHLTTSSPAANKDPLIFHKGQRKAEGILTMYMGYANIQQFVNPDNEQKPSSLWTLLTNRYKSHSKENQARVYAKFWELSYNKNIQDFLNNLNSHINAITAVGLRIGNKNNSFVHLYKLLMAEFVVSRLPSSMEVTKEILHSKRPLTLRLVMDALDSKQRESNPGPTVKSEEKALKAHTKTYPFCSNGVHNPKTKHKESKFREAKKLTKRKTANAVEASPDQCSNSSRSSAGAYICIGLALSIKATVDNAVLDSGASHHIFNWKELFANFCNRTSNVQIADGNSLCVEGDGFVKIGTLNGSTITLKSLCVPKLQGTLISLGRLLCNGFKINHVTDSKLQLLREGVPLLEANIIDNVIVMKASTQKARWAS